MNKILVEADRFLPTVFVDLLPEVPVSVEQRHCAEVQVEVTGRFAVIARKNTESAGIIWHGFVKPEFGRKIGDARRGSSKFSIGVGARQVGFEFLVNCPD